MKSFIINHLPGIFVRLFAAPYVSGNSIEKGIAKADELWNKYGFSSTMDLLGESVYTREEVERNIATYIELIDKVGDRNKYITISIKPSALGSHEGEEYCKESMRKIIDYAYNKNIKITIDMEDHTFTDLTLKIYKELLQDYPTLGTVIQSRLHRTQKDVDGLKGYKARIRTCIGIYNEPPEIALIDKTQMKEKLMKIAEQMIEDGHFVEFGTHDKKYIHRMIDLAHEKGWGSDKLEFQMLLGVPLKKIQQEILQKGYVVRLYVPFATDWKYAVPYLKRRLNNNPKMGIYVIKNLLHLN